MSKEKLKKGLAEFFRTERQRLIAYVNQLIDDTADRDGEDIVQDVALNLFFRADISLPIENLSAYIYRSLRNRAIDILRRRRTKSLSLDEEIVEHGDIALTDLIHDYRYNPAIEIDKKEFRKHIYEALETLKDDQKAIVIETEFEGRSFRELSQLWGIPLGTLLARKSRALKKIRLYLNNLE